MDEIVSAPVAFARWGCRTLAEDRHAYCLKLWNLLTSLLPKFPPWHCSYGRLNVRFAKQTFLVSKLRIAAGLLLDRLHLGQASLGCSKTLASLPHSGPVHILLTGIPAPEQTQPSAYLNASIPSACAKASWSAHIWQQKASPLNAARSFPPWTPPAPRQSRTWMVNLSHNWNTLVTLAQKVDYWFWNSQQLLHTLPERNRSQDVVHLLSLHLMRRLLVPLPPSVIDHKLL